MGSVLRPNRRKNLYVRLCLLAFPREERSCPQTKGSAKELVFAMKKNVWRAVTPHPETVAIESHIFQRLLGGRLFSRSKIVNLFQRLFRLGD